MASYDGHGRKEYAKQQFERWADTYDQSILQRLLFQRCYLKSMELILRHRAGDGARELVLLDIGCGTGTFLSMLVQAGLAIRPIGLDMAQRMCQIGSEKVGQLDLGGRVTFVVADSEHVPLAEDTFDLVTCSNSFHHYPHQAVVLDQIFRVLKPGGQVIIQDGFRDNVIGWFIFDVCVALVEKSVHHCSAGEMRRLVSACGFNDIYQEKFGLWAPVLATVASKPVAGKG